eukprot:scaffold91369_cov39-Phaeocystis_antarctica.AAC.1
MQGCAEAAQRWLAWAGARCGGWRGSDLALAHRAAQLDRRSSGRRHVRAIHPTPVCAHHAGAAPRGVGRAAAAARRLQLQLRRGRRNGSSNAVGAHAAARRERGEVCQHGVAAAVAAQVLARRAEQVGGTGRGRQLPGERAQLEHRGRPAVGVGAEVPERGSGRRAQQPEQRLDRRRVDQILGRAADADDATAALGAGGRRRRELRGTVAVALRL